MMCDFRLCKMMAVGSLVGWSLGEQAIYYYCWKGGLSLPFSVNYLKFLDFRFAKNHFRKKKRQKTSFKNFRTPPTNNDDERANSR